MTYIEQPGYIVIVICLIHIKFSFVSFIINKEAHKLHKMEYFIWHDKCSCSACYSEIPYMSHIFRWAKSFFLCYGRFEVKNDLAVTHDRELTCRIIPAIWSAALGCVYNNIGCWMGKTSPRYNFTFFIGVTNKNLYLKKI